MQEPHSKPRTNMENIEVHSKNFVIRWVHANAHTKVSWNVAPSKRSINFGVFTSSEDSHVNQNVPESSGPLKERLEQGGFEAVLPEGLVRVETREVSEGAIIIEKSCMIGFVFDNTFSISNGKLIHFSFKVELLGTSRTSSITTGEYADRERVLNPAAAAANSALYSRSSEVAAKTHRRDSLSSSAATTALGPLQSTARKGSFSQQPSSQNLTSGKDLHVNSGLRRRGTSSAVISPFYASNSSSQASIRENSTGEDETSSIRKIRRGTFNGTSTSGGNSDREPMRSLDGRYLTGFLQKKRRKQFQGFARRYFSLDKHSGLLTYHLNNKSSSLRGVMPIKMSQIKCDKHKSIIYLNSGMEKWTLKSNDAKAYDIWIRELKEVQSSGRPDESELDSEEDAISPSGDSSVVGTESAVSSKEGTPTEPELDSPAKGNAKIYGDFPLLETLQSKIVGISNKNERSGLQAVYRKLVNEIQHIPRKVRKNSLKSKFDPRKALSRSPTDATVTTFDKGSSSSVTFWHRLSHQLQSRNFIIVVSVSTVLGLFLGVVHAVVFIAYLVGGTAAGLIQFTSEIGSPPSRSSSIKSDQRVQSEKELVESSGYTGSTLQGEANKDTSANDHDEADADEDEDEEEDFKDSDEDEGSSDGSATGAGVAYIPQRPLYDAAALSAISKQYRDASEGGKGGDPDLAATFNQLADEHTTAAAAAAAEHRKVPDIDKSANIENAESEPASAETSLYPLPHAPVQRRTHIPGPGQAPPSILALLKNAKAGNPTAPIISNEPLSAIESLAEFFESADLLCAASKAPKKSNLRVMLVALFAVSRLSDLRCKERVLRKPFTPLLGETYEMVREDAEFRFVAEKVMHKPEIMACQAESPHWTAHFTSRPHSKLWAKSMQLSDVGTFNVTFPDGEGISFTNPEMFIRNILAGERYIEPTGSVTVESSSDPHINAIIEFKAGGMFSGRSEEVKITSGKIVYEGKWTEAIYHNGKVVWTAKPLVENPSKHYGFTVFDSQLNEITPIEEGKLPPNDSRMRPDLRLYESQNDVEKAEQLKLTLEQKQRERRKQFETEQKQHEPFFFVKSQNSKGLYVLRKGERNYWVQRQKQNWNGIPNYFER